MSASERAPLLGGGSDGDLRALDVDVDTPRSSAKTAAEREAFFDNAKGLTVLVVIFSHTCMSYVMLFDVAVLRACFLMGALVAMPAFSFLSGHLSSATLTPRRKVGIAKMLCTFVVYQVLYFIAAQVFVDLHVHGPGIMGGMGAQHKEALPLPVWHQENVSWFLLCLIVWRATLPLFARLKRPIAVSVLVSLATIFMDEGQNFMPIFGFLPFFIIGHTFSREDIWAARSPKAGFCYFVLPFVVLIGLSIAAGPGIQKMMAEKGGMPGPGHHDDHHDHDHGPPPMSQMGGALLFFIPSMIVEGGFQCLYQQSGQNDMNDQHRRQLSIGVGCYDVGVPMRVVFYFLSFFAIRGWLACIPRKRVPLLTNAGAFSLYGYLLHPFIIWYLPWVQEGVHIAATWAGGQEQDSMVVNVGGIVVVLVFVLAVWLGLSNIGARFVCKLCTEPAIDSLFIDEEAPTPELNKGSAGAEARQCWDCCSCLCCAKPQRQLTVTIPAGVAPGQVFSVQAPWGETVRVTAPDGAAAGGVAQFLV